MSRESKPYLSIVVPAYNESARLPSTLASIDAYLARQSFSSEIILADDGSDDDTREIASAYRPAKANLSVLALPHRGKAATVRSGILAARGDYVLFTDADLSTPIEYATQLLSALESGAEVAIGSREGSAAHRINEPAYRHIMGRVFNAVVRLLTVPGINDTQCGFKAFRAPVACDLFKRVRLYAEEGSIHGPRVTAFDVEVLFLARKRGYVIREIPVSWTHVAGSKVNPLWDSLRMFLDVVRVRFNALLGRYG